jgi:hypothetical protein
MLARLFKFLLLSIILLVTAGCSFTVTVPDVTPIVVVQSEDTPAPSTPNVPTMVPTQIPTQLPTLAPTLVPTLIPEAQNPNGCSANWFFIFNAQHRSLGAYCPEPVKALDAVGEDFEGGRVYRYAPDPAYPADQRGTIYIIYNDGEWVTFPDTWDSSQPSFDPDMLVPADRYQPVNGIGKVWREVPEVRQRLGWAYSPEVAFQGRFQAYAVMPNIPSGDSHYFFIDHGEWGLVLLLNSVDMGPNKWEVVGTYP